MCWYGRVLVPVRFPPNDPIPNQCAVSIHHEKRPILAHRKRQLQLIPSLSFTLPPPLALPTLLDKNEWIGGI